MRSHADSSQSPPLSIGKGYWWLFCFSLLFSQCQNESTAAKCKYGNPTAMFEPTMPTVKKHFFTIEKGIGLEGVAFEDKLLLEVEQKGCNDIHQNFAFTMFGDFKEADDTVWKDLAISHFRRLAGLSPKLTAFNAWADAINGAKNLIKLGEPYILEQGIQIKLDRVLSPEKAVLVVQFSQK